MNVNLVKRGKFYTADGYVNGVRIRKSTKCSVYADAQKWVRDNLEPLETNGTAKEVYSSIQKNLVKKQATFTEAFEFFLTYPRGRKPCQKVLDHHKSVFMDFASFAAANGVTAVSEVNHDTIMQYLAQLQNKGRFTPIVYECQGRKVIQEKTIEKMAPKTYNNYFGSLKLIFKILVRGNLCVVNPLEDFDKAEVVQVDREVFSPEELQLLLAEKNHFLYPLILCMVMTGLRRVDACQIKYCNISLEKNWISGEQSKVQKARYEVPLLAPLREHLLSKPWGKADDYVFPELATMYKKTPWLISSRFKELLKTVEITGVSKVASGRERASSLKDLHSLRHTFALLLSLTHAPESVVQKALGHLTPAMTRHYTNHANAEHLKPYMAALPNMIFTSAAKETQAPNRVAYLLEALAPNNIEAIKALIYQELGLIPPSLAPVQIQNVG